MEGKDHALTGGLAFAAVAPLLHAGLAGLAAGTVFTAGAALMPDLDEPGSTISRQGGFVTRGMAVAVRKLGGGHRKLTHSVIGTAGFSLLAWLGVHFDHTIAGRVILGLMIWLLLASAMHALHLGGHHGDMLAAGGAVAAVWFGAGLRWVPLCVLLGVVAHILGDMCTDHGCPVWFPLSREDHHLLREPFAFTTGTKPEVWIVRPLLIAGIALLAWRDTAHAAILHTHLAGYIGR